MTIIAPQLRAWRLRHDLTQAIAAQVLGISLRTYSGYETGKRVPPYREHQRLMARIADARAKRLLREFFSE